MSVVTDGLRGTIAMFLLQLDEHDLRAVDAFVLELVIAARDRAQQQPLPMQVSVLTVGDWPGAE